MSQLKVIQPSDRAGRFVPEDYRTDGRDEFAIRDQQASKPDDHWRPLKPGEIDALMQNENVCEDWSQIHVAEGFDPHFVRGCQFFGRVRIGQITGVSLVKNELVTPAGLYNSYIDSCDIGDDATVRNVRYLSHYIIGAHCLLLNVDEMLTTNHAKFGNGIVKEGEDEDVRVWLDLVNETGGRAVLPFDGMLAADAYLWVRYRQDSALLERFKEITQNQFDPRRGYFGQVGPRSVIKHTRIIKDVKIGSDAYIKGANKLKNLTIHSSADEPTQIGEGVEMVNGIVGLGCHVFYGCKAVRFVMGNNSALKYGGRLIHSFLGDNSTISCCEILHNLIFPAHEQHHNNSFLTASLVMGQSNLAAGATVGSNHNSRANDGEIVAGRGFWPGLCTTLKHSSKFASFTLLAKGAYPAELNVPLPFALLSDDVAHNQLVILPAFWWQYNMYALARNTWKFQTRDKRITKTQNIEFDSLAPDTAEEMIHAMRLLERWTAKAFLQKQGEDPSAKSNAELEALGKTLLTEADDRTAGLEVLGEKIEATKRKTRIVKPRSSYHAYREMLLYYGVKNLLDYLDDHPKATQDSTRAALAGTRKTDWVNLGGQLLMRGQLDDLFTKIKSGELNEWDAIHGAYDALWAGYRLDKQRHAYATLCDLMGDTGELSHEVYKVTLSKAIDIQRFICEQVYHTREKDFSNPFRQATFESREEQDAVVGTIEDNSFVVQTRSDTDAFVARCEAALLRK